MKHFIIVCNVVIMLALSMASLADEYHTVDPPFLDLTLNEGEMVNEQVSLTINPYCIRPFYVDVIASDPRVLVTNLTGVLINGCGGETSVFDVEFSGTSMPQQFDLQFVDTGSGGVLATIPLNIYPRQIIEPLMGVIFHKHGIVFQVMSSGCTQKSDFDLQVMESHPLQLSLIRTNPDSCDAYEPLGKRIFFRYDELGIPPGNKLRVVNPLGTLVVPY
jgi:hypothetical protein